MGKLILTFLNWWKDRLAKTSLGEWALVILSITTLWLLYKPFAKPEMSINLQSELQMSQNVGNIVFGQFVSIKNIGDKAGGVLKVEGLVRSKDRDVLNFRKKISAKYYRYVPSGRIPAIEINLKPGENYFAQLEMYEEPGRSTRDSIAVIQALLLNQSENDIRNNKNQLSISNESNKLGSMIEQFIKRRVQELKEGEYEYIIQFTKIDENELEFSKCYSFSLYAENIFNFKESIKDFKIYPWYNLPLNRREGANIILTEILNPEIISSLKEDLKKK